ncbi:hypothetical protein GCM10027280_47950 [Micromonospora polyrhachis]|uniref:Transmembrane protein n=1 Tax=Micromonospora polyrhachis TaxID=1282883 RepID=A0A7W7WRK3_9ACTN|nr:hypothetical protein [Micromonospora polyrhachis]MBB4960647.1 hypothetical protein [Micromonospora polyrhachis]
MKIYADRFPVATRQLLTDLLVVVWVYLWIRGAMWLHDLVQKLALPGQKLEGAGGGLAENLADASGKVGRVPVVGDDLTAPFEKAAGAARTLADAGRDQQELIGELALVLALAVLVFPLGLVLFGWLPLRVRWIRRATAAAHLRSAPAGRDLLALRALANQPLRKLARIDPDVVRAWRQGDDAIVDDLAALELRGLGLRNG